MISGSFPCCSEPLGIEMPEGGPFYVEDICPACGARIWHKLSRIDPASYLEADFLAEFDVDRETRIVTERNPPSPSSPLEEELQERFAALIAKAWEERIIHGSGQGLPVGIFGSSVVADLIEQGVHHHLNGIVIVDGAVHVPQGAVVDFETLKPLLNLIEKATPRKMIVSVTKAEYVERVFASFGVKRDAPGYTALNPVSRNARRGPKRRRR